MAVVSIVFNQLYIILSCDSPSYSICCHLIAVPFSTGSNGKIRSKDESLKESAQVTLTLSNCF